jgi:hypothetical protein
MHLFIDPDVVWQVEFDFTVTVLKDSLKDYGITRAKLVNSLTHHINVVTLYCIVPSLTDRVHSH